MFPIRDHNPSRSTPWMTYLLIAVNAAIYLWGLAFWQSIDAQYDIIYCCAMIPARISNGEAYISLLTSAFLHGGFLHLAGNMLFLWIFGDNLEDEMGRWTFLAFYLAAACGAGIAQWAIAPWSPVPMVGASGAVAGVMGGYLLLYPRAKVDVLLIIVIFFRIFPIPAWVMLGVWFLFQVIYGALSNAWEGGIAYWAHAGGFVVGLVLTLPVWLRLGGRTFWQRSEGHPPHPPAPDLFGPSSIPRISRRRR